jgi:hypothetical protein
MPAGGDDVAREMAALLELTLGQATKPNRIRRLTNA